MTRKDSKLAAVLAPISEPMTYCPSRIAALIDTAEVFSDPEVLKEVPEISEIDPDDLEEAKKIRDAVSMTFRFKHLGDAEHFKLQTDLDILVASMKSDPEKREQASKIVLGPLEGEPDEVVIDMAMQMQSNSGAFITNPEDIDHPENLLKLTAEKLREYLPAVTEFGSHETVRDYNRVITNLEYDAVHTDWDAYMLRIGVSQTQQDDAEIALMSDGSLLSEEQVKDVKRDIYMRAVATICEANRIALEEQREELRQQSRATIEHSMVNMVLTNLISRYARSQYINTLIMKMTEIKDEETGEFSQAFESVEEVDRLATVEGLHGELYTWLCDRIAEILPSKEAQLVKSSRFRDDVDYGTEW